MAVLTVVAVAITTAFILMVLTIQKMKANINSSIDLLDDLELVQS